VGEGKYVVALTADHGVCPLPEAARARGLAADRINPVLLALRATEFLDETSPARGGKAPGRWLEALQGPGAYLNRGLIRARGLKQAEVETALAGWLARQPGSRPPTPGLSCWPGRRRGTPWARRCGARSTPAAAATWPWWRSPTYGATTPPAGGRGGRSCRFARPRVVS
jgi:hypothetical protein